MKLRILFIYTSILLLVSGCSNITILNPKSATGKDQAYLIWLSLGIMSIVILVVFILFALFIVKYRYTKERGSILPEDIKGNKKLELTYTIIPCVLLIILAIPTVKITMEQSPSIKLAKENEEQIHIEVTARQFEWAFEHENGKHEKDILIIPEDKEVVFHLKSEDVIHSFWVPELAGKVDVFPNKELMYVIDEAEKGTYQGKCAEFCGVQHANMIFTTKVVSQEDYLAYLNEQTH